VIGRRSIRAALACAIVAAGAMVLALAPGPASAQDDAPFVGWNPLLPSLANPYHPSRERDCVDGDPRCIEQTLAQMYERFDRLYATCDHNAVFGITYIRVTEAIRQALLRGFYEEPWFLHHEDRVFARMYFESYDAWREGRREVVPPAWREAFDAARERSVSGVGNLLMSMNAHINRDMPFMLDALGLTMPDGRSRKPDHDRGNEVLNTLYDDVLKELAERFDPGVDDANAEGSTGDDAAVFQVLQGWREQVWRHAEMLGAAQTPEQRKVVADYIEEYALGIARQIRANTTIADSSARDAHCAAYRRSHRESGGLARAVSTKPRSRVRVLCPGPVRGCRPTVTVLHRGRRLTRPRTVALEPRQSRVIGLKRTRRGKRLLARVRRPRVRLVAESPSAWGTSRTAVVRTRLKR